VPDYVPLRYDLSCLQSESLKRPRHSRNVGQFFHSDGPVRVFLLSGVHRSLRPFPITYVRNLTLTQINISSNVKEREPGSKVRVAKPGRARTPPVPLYRAQPNVTTKQPGGAGDDAPSRVLISARCAATSRWLMVPALGPLCSDGETESWDCRAPANIRRMQRDP
jgi:hypothetical protein